MKRVLIFKADEKELAQLHLEEHKKLNPKSKMKLYELKWNRDIHANYPDVHRKGGWVISAVSCIDYKSNTMIGRVKL